MLAFTKLLQIRKYNISIPNYMYMLYQQRPAVKQLNIIVPESHNAIKPDHVSDVPQSPRPLAAVGSVTVSVEE